MNKERNRITGLDAGRQCVMNKERENLNMGNNNGRYTHNGRHEIRETKKESMTLGENEEKRSNFLLKESQTCTIRKELMG
jgi:hypothetical protein